MSFDINSSLRQPIIPLQEFEATEWDPANRSDYKFKNILAPTADVAGTLTRAALKRIRSEDVVPPPAKRARKIPAERVQAAPSEGSSTSTIETIDREPRYAVQFRLNTLFRSDAQSLEDDIRDASIAIQALRDYQRAGSVNPEFIQDVAALFADLSRTLHLQ